jgi:hypothetical protein
MLASRRNESLHSKSTTALDFSVESGSLVVRNRNSDLSGLIKSTKRGSARNPRSSQGSSSNLKGSFNSLKQGKVLQRSSNVLRSLQNEEFGFDKPKRRSGGLSRSSTNMRDRQKEEFDSAPSSSSSFDRRKKLLLGSSSSGCKSSSSKQKSQISLKASQEETLAILLGQVLDFNLDDEELGINDVSNKPRSSLVGVARTFTRSSSGIKNALGSTARNLGDSAITLMANVGSSNTNLRGSYSNLNEDSSSSLKQTAKMVLSRSSAGDSSGNLRNEDFDSPRSMKRESRGLSRSPGSLRNRLLGGGCGLESTKRQRKGSSNDLGGSSDNLKQGRRGLSRSSNSLRNVQNEELDSSPSRSSLERRKNFLLGRGSGLKDKLTLKGMHVSEEETLAMLVAQELMYM